MIDIRCQSLSLPVVREALINIIALARIAWRQACASAIESGDSSGVAAIEIAVLRQELAWLDVESRIKDARLARIPGNQRPRYSSTERMAIRELITARGWSIRRAARRFLVSRGTLHGWRRRLADEGANALLAIGEPVNRFPDYLRHAIRRIKVLCPFLGKQKIAELLSEAGLHIARSTVGRILKEMPKKPDERILDDLDIPNDNPPRKPTVVTAKYPNHLWHIDLTVIRITGGFSIPWLPNALPQMWPFGGWTAVVVDHFSRRAMGFPVFRNQPSSQKVQEFLDSVTQECGEVPKYIVSDRGTQFDCDEHRGWCESRGIKWRYGTVGRHGSVAVVERFILTMKTILGRGFAFLMMQETIERELDLVFIWYNEHKTHSTLGGRTPNQVYYRRFPGNRKPHLEPRERWPRGSPCAQPNTPVRGKVGQKVIIQIDDLEGRSHLPVISIRPAA